MGLLELCSKQKIYHSHLYTPGHKLKQTPDKPHNEEFFQKTRRRCSCRVPQVGSPRLTPKPPASLIHGGMLKLGKSLKRLT